MQYQKGISSTKVEMESLFLFIKASQKINNIRVSSYRRNFISIAF